MKKENITGIVVYLVIFALAIVFGLVFLKEYFSQAGDRALEAWQFGLLILGAVITGAILNATIFELGHLLGAKIGGYKVVSCSILGLTFYKDNEKLKLRIANYDGLTGETKITPKANAKKEPNPTFYLLSGTLFYAIEIVLAIILFSWISSQDTATNLHWGYFIITAAIVGALILLYNIIPLKLDAMNDGYRLRQVSGKKNRKAFNNLLRIENGEQPITEDGQTPIPTPFAADIKLNKLYETLALRDYAGAEEVLDKDILTNEKISKNVYLRARAQKIYCRLMMAGDIEEVRKFYDEEYSLKERKLISEDISMDCIRAYILMSGLLDKSRSECVLALKNLYKAYKGVPEQRKVLERGLFNEALNKVIAAHPTWELENYLMKNPEE